MTNFYIYIVTDCNRRYLEVALTNDLSLTLNELRDASNFLFHSGPHLNRIIHLESFSSSEAAQKRQQEISRYTRMQKEKLVRRSNPNWMNLYPIHTASAQKKSARYTA